MSESVHKPPVDRRTRRREQTRAKLVEAARATFARQGVDATRINEITEEADVGFGSFYNYFESKDAIVAAVVEAEARAAGEAIEAATRDIEDPAEVVAFGHRWMIRRAQDDPEFGWLLVRLEVSHGLASATLGPYALRDFRAGIKAGRFAVEDEAVAFIAAGGALLSVVRAVLQGHVGGDAAVHHAAGVLRLYGLPAKEAAKIAARPLPEV